MELVHLLSLETSGQLRQSIVVSPVVDHDGREVKSLRLSFYPYLLAAKVDPSAAGFELLLEPKKVRFVVGAVDEERHEPFLRPNMQSTALLLMSEVVHGVYEAVEGVGFRFLQTSCDPDANLIYFEWQSHSKAAHAEFLRAVAQVYKAIEYLLFARGLLIDRCHVHLEPFDNEDRHVVDILNRITSSVQS